MIPYTRQSINGDDIQAVAKALEEDIITRGSHVDAFEKAMAEYCGARYGVTFNSGTSALIAACHAIDLSPYDRVITSPNTFVATVGAGWRFGAPTTFVDIDRDTGNLDLDQLAYNINIPSTRGRTIIFPVHFSGIPVDMQKLEQMIEDPNTIVIEDAAHALGSQYRDGQKVGCCAWSQMTIFSFHPAKTITTGEGGMVMTNDENIYSRLKQIRNNGITRQENNWFYEVQQITGNYHMNDFQAALGLSQLQRLDSFVQKRRDLVKAYRDKLKDVPNIRLFTDAFDDLTSFHLMVVQIDNRDEVMTKLKEKEIGTQVHYIPVYRHPFFTKKNGDICEYFPNMEGYFAQALSLPLYSDLTVEDVDRIVALLKN